MKTTELVIEQVIIGIAVLFTACAMMWPDAARAMYRMDDISKVVVLIAVAYVVGIVYDRVADTLLEDLERHHRLLYALDLYYDAPDTKGDPFPEDEWRDKVMSASGASEYGDYLRSRIRLTRAFTSLVPAFGMAAALTLTNDRNIRFGGAVATLAVYLAALALKIIRRTRLTRQALRSQPDADFALPRTEALVYDDVRSWYVKQIGYDDTERRSKLGWQFALRKEPLSLGAILLAIAAGIVGGIAAGVQHRTVFQGVLTGTAIASASVLLTALFGWSWWRITATHFGFLKTFNRTRTAQSHAPWE